MIETRQVESHLRALDEGLEKRIKKRENILKENLLSVREKIVVHTGRILHIDGDKKYSEKSSRYYRKMGLDAIVRNIPERRQPMVIGSLVKRYKPEIVVITGHDRDGKKRH